MGYLVSNFKGDNFSLCFYVGWIFDIVTAKMSFHSVAMSNVCWSESASLLKQESNSCSAMF